MENIPRPESCPHCGAHEVNLKRAYIREYYGDFGRSSKLKAIGWYCEKCSFAITQCTVPADPVHCDIVNEEVPVWEPPVKERSLQVTGRPSFEKCQGCDYCRTHLGDPYCEWQGDAFGAFGFERCPGR